MLAPWKIGEWQMANGKWEYFIVGGAPMVHVGSSEN
jgi:hypothetical protein